MSLWQEQSRWRWRITRTLESIGRNGWLGLAVLLLALLFSATMLRGLAEKKRNLERELGELRQGRLGEGGKAPVSLATLLPGAATSGEFANLLNALALREGVRIDRMEYQLQRESGKPVLLYRAELVAIAPYLKIRGWLDAILTERPTVAVEELVFERPNANAAEVVVRLRLVLFMKGEQ